MGQGDNGYTQRSNVVRYPPPKDTIFNGGQATRYLGHLPRMSGGVEQGIQNWGGAISISRITPPEQSEPLVRQRKPRGMVPHQPNNYWYGKESAKFSDCANGQYSTIGAYNEQEEREIAENIIDWWISKKSYRQWYAEKFLQQKLDLFDDEE